MAIYRYEVVYVDPTSEGKDVLSAAPEAEGLPSISTTRGADFGDTYVSNVGETVSVGVNPDDVPLLLARMGDRLRGIHADDSNKTIVGTVEELKKACHDLGITEAQTTHLLAGFTQALVGEGMII